MEADSDQPGYENMIDNANVAESDEEGDVGSDEDDDMAFSSCNPFRGL